MISINKAIDVEIIKERERLLRKKTRFILWYDKLKNWKPYTCEHCDPIESIKIDCTNQVLICNIRFKKGRNFIKHSTILFDEICHFLSLDPEKFHISSYSMSVDYWFKNLVITFRLNDTCTIITREKTRSEVIGYSC